MANPCLSIDPGRCFTTGFMGPKIHGIIYSLLAGAALRPGFFATEDIVKMKRDHLLEELNRYKMKIRQLMMFILEMDTAMKAKSANLVDIDKPLATMKTKKGFWKSLIRNFFLLQHGKGLRVPARETFLLKLSPPPPIYLEFALHVEKAIIPYCRREVSGLGFFTSKLQWNWRRYGENA